MRTFLQSILLFAASLSGCLMPATAHASTYEALAVDVPFKFTIGERTFRPGHYQFVLMSDSVVALRDSKAHTVASLMTRTLKTDGPVAISKLVFSKGKKHSQLTRIWVANRSEVLEVMGEQVAMRPAPTPAPSSTLRLDVESLFDRNYEPRFKQ